MINVLIVVVNMASFRAPPKSVHALIKGFSDLKASIKLVSANIDKKLEFSSNCSTFEVLRSSRNIFSLANNIQKIRFYAKDIDVIYVPIALETLLMSQIARDKTLVAGPNIQPFPILRKYRYKPLNFLCNHFVAYNDGYKGELIKGGLSPEKITVIPHPADIEAYTPIKRDKSFWFKYGWKNDDLVVLFVGRLEEHKGILKLLSAFNRISSEYSKVKLAIISSGGKYEKHVKDASQKKTNIKYINLMAENKVQIAYASSDIGIFPSLKEGFGLVYLESMASGLPTVGVNAGGPKEIIIDGYNGVLLRDNTEKSIYHALVRLIEDEYLRKRIGMNARRTVEEKYSPEHIAKEHIKMLKTLLKY